MNREQVINDLDRAVRAGLIQNPCVRHHFTLRKDYIYIHVTIDCEPYEWTRGLYTNRFSTSIRIPTSEYSYRRLANGIRKAKKEHEKKHKKSANRPFEEYMNAPQSECPDRTIPKGAIYG